MNQSFPDPEECRARAAKCEQIAHQIGNPPSGRYVMFRQDHPVLGAVSALISDTDNKAASPEQLNLLFDAGIQELEPSGELGRRGNLEASAGCRQIDHRAVDDRLFRIDNDLARLRHHAVRPDADKSAEFAQNGTSNDMSSRISI